MNRLNPLTQADRPLIHQYLDRFPPHISELTFTNLFVWQSVRPVWFLQQNNSLVFFTGSKDAGQPDTLFGNPLGDLPLVPFVKSLDQSIHRIVRLPEPSALALSQAGYPIVPDRDDADYVYLVRDLAELSGRRYAKKRNHINNCLRQYLCRYEPFTPDLVAECLNMQDRWCDMRECSIDPGLFGENEAIKQAFLHFDDFNLIGGAIRVDGAIKAYAMAEKLNPDTAVWHFEKAMPDIEGLGQLINHWFAKYALDDFKYVNREQDLGIPGLRRAKESYYPHHMVDKYTVALAS